MTTAAAYLKALKGYEGVRENPLGSNRTPFAAMAGHANGLFWCATFQVGVARKIGLQLPPGADTASTVANESAYKRAGRLSTKPRVGSVFFVYFPSKGKVAHTGVVWKVAGNYVHTIEGNAQPLTSKVLTASGWKLMGDVQVGDEVIDPEGMPSRVTGVHPKGVRPVYRVTFTDGSTVEACDEHLWSFDRIDRPSRGGGYQKCVASTLELKALIDQPLSRRAKVRMPQVRPVEFTQTEPLPMDPYLLGCLLGDGGLTRPGAIRFTCADPEILAGFTAAVESVGDEVVYVQPMDYRVRGGNLLKLTAAMGIHGQGALSKRVPPAYLLAGVKDRIALLQGLMDTDGSIDQQGRAEFCSISRGLAEDVQHLVRSLGGKTRLCPKTGITYTAPQQQTPKAAQDAYILRNIRLPGVGVVPFRTSRKVDRWRTDKAFSRGWGVKSVEYVRDDEVQCISVSAPSHLYVTDDFIATHNSNDDGSRDGYEVCLRKRLAHRATGTVGIRSYGMPLYDHALTAQEADVALDPRDIERIADAVMHRLATQPIVPNPGIRKGDPDGKDMTVVGAIANIETNQDSDRERYLIPTRDALGKS